VPSPPKDGGCMAMLNMAETLHLIGADVKMLAMDTHKHPLMNNAYSEDFKLKFNPESIAIDTRITAKKAITNLLFSKRSYHLVRFECKAFTDKVIELLNTFQPDMVLLDSLYTCGYINTIRTHSKAKIIYRAHNVEYLIWDTIAKQTNQALKKYYLNIQSRRLQKEEMQMIALCDAVIAITEKDHQFFSLHFPKKKILTFPFTVDLRQYPVNDDYRTQALFFIGAMDWHPNLEAVQWFLEKVWPAVTKKYGDVKFYIAGKAMPLSLKKDVHQHVINMGEVDDAGKFIFGFPMMVAPLFSGGGLKIKMIEAMASGKVVICTSKAAEGIKAIDGTHLLIAETAEAFVQKIDDCLNGKINLKGIGENARKLIDSHFGIASKAITIQTFLQSV
jgi:glycosyltransferase involved in cell wall biosynthesis